MTCAGVCQALRVIPGGYRRPVVSSPLSSGRVLFVFDVATGAGLYEVIWDIGLGAPGFVNSGNFVLSGEWWSSDPFGGGSFMFSEPDIQPALFGREPSRGSGAFNVVAVPRGWGGTCAPLRAKRVAPEAGLVHTLSPALSLGPADEPLAMLEPF